jgi:hypothetical protein
MKYTHEIYLQLISADRVDGCHMVVIHSGTPAKEKLKGKTQRKAQRKNKLSRMDQMRAVYKNGEAIAAGDLVWVYMKGVKEYRALGRVESILASGRDIVQVRIFRRADVPFNRSDLHAVVPRSVARADYAFKPGDTVNRGFSDYTVVGVDGDFLICNGPPPLDRMLGSIARLVLSPRDPEHREYAMAVETYVKGQSARASKQRRTVIELKARTAKRREVQLVEDRIKYASAYASAVAAAAATAAAAVAVPVPRPVRVAPVRVAPVHIAPVRVVPVPAAPARAAPNLLTCKLCEDYIINRVMVCCGQAVCDVCWDTWAAKPTRSCPFCRKEAVSAIVLRL